MHDDTSQPGNGQTSGSDVDLDPACPDGSPNGADRDRLDTQWLSIGQVISDRYEVQQVLGLGGMGLVVSAHDRDLNCLVAVKLLRSSLSEHPEARRRFFLELRAMRKLQSNHAVRLLNAGVWRGAPYMVIEFLSGESCAARLERSGPVPFRSAVEWILQACEAIDEAHRHGIVHRDLKPENLFLMSSGSGPETVKVLDFGISKMPLQMGDGEAVTATHAIMGSPCYMPPEQITASKNVDARSDIWSFGVVLFELLTGRLPFEADHMMKLMKKILSSPPRSALEICPQLPVGLDAVIQRCLEKQRLDRYQTVGELSRALAPFALDVKTTSPTGSAIRGIDRRLAALEDPTRVDRRPGKPTNQPYRCLLQLGEGGSARVMLAVMRGAHSISKLSVLKMLRRSDWDEATVRMFRAEARLVSRMSHPNIVALNDVIENDGQPTLVMEYLEGQSLSQIVRSAGDELPLELHLFVLCEMLAGLHYAHELTEFGSHLNLVHRDVSPANVFVTYNGQVKVLDFGIAKVLGSDDQTRTGIVKGKLHYMAPEQIAGERGLDRRADIFAAGVMLWQALTGRRLWRSSSDEEVMRRVIAGNLVKPSEIAPGCPAELERICMKAMANDRDDRYGTAAELRAEIEGFLTARRTPVSGRRLAVFMGRRFGAERDNMNARIQSLLSNEPFVQRSTVPAPRDSCGTVVMPRRRTQAPRRPRSGLQWLVAATAACVFLLGVAVLKRGGESGVPDGKPAHFAAPTAAGDLPRAELPLAVVPVVEASASVPRAPERGETVLPNTLAAPSAPDATQRAELRTHKPTRAVATIKPPEIETKVETDHVASDPKAASRCATPFFIDGEGIKRFKPDCI